jgi:hypothetical protein
VYLQKQLLVVERDGLRLGVEVQGALERIHNVMRHLRTTTTLDHQPELTTNRRGPSEGERERESKNLALQSALELRQRLESEVAGLNRRLSGLEVGLTK